MIRNPIRYYQLNINEEFQSRTILKNKNSRIEKNEYYIDLNNLPEQKTETFYYGTTNMTLVSFFTGEKSHMSFVKKSGALLIIEFSSFFVEKQFMLHNWYY